MITTSVVTTIDDADKARAIAKAIVGQKLAACAQISAIESVYNWDGALQNDAEFRILFKTTDERYADVEAAILELHTYDLPAIFAWEAKHVFEPYAKWVAENSQGND